MIFDKINKRLVVLCGHYGTGKTNIAVNLARYAVSLGKKVCITDLDIVNPYFRTADNAEELKSLGVRTIIPEYANSNVDIPSIPSEFQSVFESDELCFVDVGGDDGAVALGTYAESFEREGYDMLYVYSAYRPMIRETEDAMDSLAEIEYLSRMKCTGIVNNSNLGVETDAETVKKSVEACKSFAERAGLPIVFTSAVASVAKLLEGEEGIGEILAIKDSTKKLF